MKKIFAAIAAAVLLAACNQPYQNPLESLDYDALNAQALEEYLSPVHPGVPGEVPFWNKFATKYIYAPVFEFEQVDGAANYCLSIPSGGESLFVCNNAPVIALSPIWNELPVGWIEATMQATGADGMAVGSPVALKFEKDNPFHGPYEPAPIGYRESAIKAAKALHDSPLGQSWTGGNKPDTTYFYNCYACKIWSGIAQTECFLAREVPEYHDAALAIARNACDGLIAIAQPEGAPLAFFPPTYYYGENNEISTSVLRFNVGKTMFLEATYAANALLDLYDLTKEEKYLDHALGIAKTYQRLQAEDGSWPVKLCSRQANR